MSADREEVNRKRKRERQSQSDDKLEHDLYEQLEPQALNLKSFLQELHLEKYLTKFQKQKIGMSLVPIMTDCDLLAIGIKEKDDRKKIREALKAMPRDVSTSRRAF